MRVKHQKKIWHYYENIMTLISLFFFYVALKRHCITHLKLWPVKLLMASKQGSTQLKYIILPCITFAERNPILVYLIPFCSRMSHFLTKHDAFCTKKKKSIFLIAICKVQVLYYPFKGSSDAHFTQVDMIL